MTLPERAPSADAAALLEAARGGQRRALARVMSMVERGGADARRLGMLTFAASGHAHTVGITGAPGAGKSTLNSALVSVARERAERVAVLAVDPSSPFSGGAILGDRVRMTDHTFDEGVYIRSMATRGHLGGLTLATPLAVRVLDALGWPWVVVETVGVGQVETEIAGAADTTVVVVNPGWGDSVQANKAGLMEIADIFVVNKADRPGTPETCRDIRQMLDLSAPGDWDPPILTSVGTTGEGAAELWAAVCAHRTHATATGELAAQRAARVEAELDDIVRASISQRVATLSGSPLAQQLRERLARRELDPYAAAEMLLAETC
ncbi:methylmalonyl Co-A mutase-associated GTPase MeaB [Candidatus Poriferisodalis sp.]|uniref:methylmalonyl Co-A mutase-associated GTPase MeaB n=1 Tax=Candidatus Poriferisodalis sp. TaxID=3101277 RepID=UPI003B0127C9